MATLGELYMYDAAVLAIGYFLEELLSFQYQERLRCGALCDAHIARHGSRGIAVAITASEIGENLQMDRLQLQGSSGFA